ncbi:TetR/AcrR family transcriptional regulator [Rhodococcus spelaei]|uniref:TetR/AcrR family transcriptional regulator n=1 Tax=Rhodococcus spelaei TaxID=2546320 RepID=A0A541B4H4_9NOCA|nr:TetR/AcrR family transcriptional regulator [Rhodococcus spelaei]TQF67211.1 TetR/AcrR family transcriptional regulator [Rhodococcus spelaei]
MDTADERDLPRTVALAWGLAEAGSRGPRRGLSIEQIVDTAIELADADGIAALSMARVAKQLGFTTMSLYRYVASKDELVELISDRVVGPPPAIAPSTPWREALAAWAGAEYAALMRHPWWLQLSIGGAPPTGPNNIAWLDAGLSALTDTPLPHSLRFQVVLTTSLYVIGRARFAADFATASATVSAEDAAVRDYPALLPRLFEPDRFPHLSEALAAGAFDPDPDVEWEDADFGFALDLLLDGVEQLIDAHR